MCIHRRCASITFNNQNNVQNKKKEKNKIEINQKERNTVYELIKAKTICFCRTVLNQQQNTLKK